MEIQVFNPTVFAAGCALFAGVLLLYRAILPKPIPGIPYKKTSAKRLLGDAPDLIKWQGETQEIWSYIRHLAEEFNSPIFQVFMRPFGKPWVIITDFREAQDIQTARKEEFDRAAIVGEAFGPLIPENHLQFPTGDKWRANRQLIRDTLSPSFVNEVLGASCYQSTKDLIGLWRKKARLAHGRPFNADADIVRCLVDLIIAATFGFEVRSLRTQEEIIGRSKIDLPASLDAPVNFPTAEIQAFTAIRNLGDSVQIAMGSPVPRLALGLALRLFPSLISARRYVDGMITSRLRAAWIKFSGNAEQRRNRVGSVAEQLVQREAQAAQKEGRPVNYDTPVIRDELFGFFLAGQETTSTTLCWAVKYLSVNPAVQRQLRAALRQAHPHACEAGELPSREDIIRSHVPYLDAFIQENHRMGNSVNSVVRKAVKDEGAIVFGHRIPRGTDVFMLTNGPGYKTPSLPVSESQRSPTSRDLKEKFGAWDDTDITSFKPERWLYKDEGSGEVRYNSSAGPVHPYGAGPRACFGMKWAQLMLKMTITMIVWSFEFHETPESLSGFEACDITTHRAQKTYLRLAEVEAAH